MFVRKSMRRTAPKISGVQVRSPLDHALLDYLDDREPATVPREELAQALAARMNIYPEMKKGTNS